MQYNFKKQNIFIIAVLYLLVSSNVIAAEKHNKNKAENIRNTEEPNIFPGRYQLFQGEYQYRDFINNGFHTQKELLLLDTSTGKIYKCGSEVSQNESRGVDIFTNGCFDFDAYQEVPLGTLKKK